MEQALFVWASGRVQCGDDTPPGAIEVARGSLACLYSALMETAQINPVTHYWEVPEVAALQENPRAAVDALIDWRARFMVELESVEARHVA